MDRTRYSTIAHRDHQFCSPLSGRTVDTVLAHLRLAPGARLLDVGCGKAHMLARAVRRYEANGIGIDPNVAFLQEAPPDSRIVLHASRVQEVPLQRESFDAALCIGSTHAFGTCRDALRELAALVRPGGRLAVGEGVANAPGPLQVLVGLERDLDLIVPDGPEHLAELPCIIGVDGEAGLPGPRKEVLLDPTAMLLR